MAYFLHGTCDTGCNRTECLVDVSCTPLVVQLQHLITAPDQSKQILAEMIAFGSLIGAGVASACGLALCAWRRYRRRQAGIAGLYTFGSDAMPDADEEKEAGFNPVGGYGGL